MATAKTKKLRVSHVRIQNVLGIEELEFDPGKHVTMITGANGSGKTSVLEAIRSVLKGGHSAELIHQGTKKGEVVIVLSDGVVLEKKISPGRSAVSVKHPDTGPMDAPQTLISELTDSMGANPIEFLTASTKDRVRLFLEMVDAKPDPAKLSAITDLCSEQFTPAPDAFTTLERAAKDISSQRREINRQVKEKREGAAQLRKSQPEGEVPEDLEATLAELQKRMRADEERRDQAIAEITAARDREIEEIRAAAEKRISDTRELHAAQREQTGRRIAELSAFQKAAAAREFIGNMEAAAKSLEADSETFSDTLARITELQKELCTQLPIEGAEILDGELFIGGVTFDHVNESLKVQIAIDLAVRHASDKALPLIVVDGLERLDSDSMTLFLEAAAKTDCQMIMTRVSDIPGLAVEAYSDEG